MDGILAVDKPRGWTSHDVVARVRRLTGQRRVGHAGTLDPMASGVLLLCLGEITRLSEYLMDGTKWYAARVRFGIRTDTDDAEGRPIGEAAPCFDLPRLEAALARQVGVLDQVPPAFAAIKQGGVPAYRRARQGQEMSLAARRVTIYGIALLASRPGIDEGPDHLIASADLLISCSKGTYIRSIARDLGEDLGCGAHLSGLRRLASGAFTTRDCLDLRDLPTEGALDVLADALALPDVAVSASAAMLAGPAVARRLGSGALFEGPKAVLPLLRVYDSHGNMLALARPAEQGEGWWHGYRVFAGGS